MACYYRFGAYPTTAESNQIKFKANPNALPFCLANAQVLRVCCGRLLVGNWGVVYIYVVGGRETSSTAEYFLLKKIILGKKTMKRFFPLLLILSSSFLAMAQKPEPYLDEKTNKYGYKDESGKIVIKPLYDIAYEFTDGKYAEVNIGADYEKNKGGKWGIIDTKGKLVHPVKYDNAKCLGYNLFALNIGHRFSNMDATPSGKFAIFNAAGKALTPFIYSGFLTAVRFNEGYAPLETWDGKKQRYGLLDSTGKVAVPAKYDEVGNFREGMCKLTLNGKSGFIDKTVKLVIPMKYEEANIFSEGLAAVKLNGKYGFINPKGQEVISFEYEDANYFEEGYAAVKKNGKWGIINNKNKLIVDFIYDGISWIKNDANEIRVKKDNKYINVDRQGNEIKN